MSNRRTLDLSDVPQCVDCGACCFSRSQEYLRVLGVDYDRLGDQADELTNFVENRAFMRMKDGHCVALVYSPEQGQFLCSIYERRPDVCRWLERGSGQCAAERHEKAGRTDALVRITVGPEASPGHDGPSSTD